MPEYIERENAYKLISEHIEEETGMYTKGRNVGLNIAKSIIHSKEQCPTADVVEVVRCKDCKHYHKGKESTICDYDYCDILYYCDGTHRTACERDFCNYGELKERD